MQEDVSNIFLLLFTEVTKVYKVTCFEKINVQSKVKPEAKREILKLGKVNLTSSRCSQIMSQKYCITVLRNIPQYCTFTWKTNPIHSEKWNPSYLNQGACDFLITKKISRDFDEFFENHYILEELVSRITTIEGGLPIKRGSDSLPI